MNLTTRLATLALASLPLALSAQTAPLKVGLMLPATGTFASLGDMIEKGFKLYVQEQGGKLGGREIQYFKVERFPVVPEIAGDAPEICIGRDVCGMANGRFAR